MDHKKISQFTEEYLKLSEAKLLGLNYQFDLLTDEAKEALRNVIETRNLDVTKEVDQRTKEKTAELKQMVAKLERKKNEKWHSTFLRIYLPIAILVVVYGLILGGTSGNLLEASLSGVGKVVGFVILYGIYVLVKFLVNKLRGK